MIRVSLHVLSAAIVGVLGLFAPFAHAEHFDIVYPRFMSVDDPRAAYAKAVLDLAMREAHADYTVRPSHDVMQRERALRELAEGRSVNLAWVSMSADDEARLRPIRMPIYRGLIGYRVLLIRKDRQAEFDKINSLDALKAMTGGQGFGWVDTEILRDAGLHIDTSTYDSLFRMTEAGRIDYFPRGLVEAWTELKALHEANPDLVVERHLMLVYRSDFIFYTSKRDEQLARTIESGLRAAYRDGSFQRLFDSQPCIRTALERADLGHRTVIYLDNRHLSDADRDIPNEYWMPN
ncbi:substrate-binding periplasmic protein [Trinickia acidisoli]|uniref:substrate-binding periplasmic protein n=1 Tax=Trinickia acidisoli TaxID=2767482 RepID=UPI001A8CC630|nr:ABC transporter substrate-binding protein [Trinickia acidisoli]